MKRILVCWIFVAVFVVNDLSAQNCDYFSKGNDIVQDKPCAPVEATWDINYGGLTYTGTDVKIYIDWDDGTPPEIVNATYNTTLSRWETQVTRTYPKGGDKCNYVPETMLMVAGELCTSSIQTQQVTVWDVDDENGGVMSINPEVFPICLGDDGTVTFTDASQWNCVPPIEEDRKNTNSRWVQWIYGTGGTTIDQAEVGGSVLSYPFSGPVEKTPQPIEGPVPPMNQSMEIYIPDYYEVGDYFEVTLRTWNQCNPYDDPTIAGEPTDPNGDHPPVITTAMALIVALPDGTITAVGPFCDNETAQNLTLEPSATTGGLWSGPGIIDEFAGLFSPATAGPGIHTIHYEVTSDAGCTGAGTTTIEVFESPDLSLTDGTPVYLCPGLNKQLEVNISNGTEPYTISWLGDTGPLSSTIITNPIFETTTVGEYNMTFRVVDDKNCRTDLPITIGVEPVEITFSPPIVEVCQNTPATLTPIVDGGSRNFILHEWTGPAANKLSATDVENPDFLTDETGTFTLTYEVTDDMGCSDMATVTIIVKEQPLALAGDDAALCELSYTLQGSSQPALAGEWTLEAGPGTATFVDMTSPTSEVTVSETGSYTFLWSVDLDGCQHSDEVTITFAPLPAPGIMDDASVCGLSIELQAIPDIGSGQWLKTSGEGEAVFVDETAPLTNVQVSLPGNYIFTWQETSGASCHGEASVSITFLPQALAMVDPLPQRGCSPYEVTLSNVSENAESYQWELGGGVTSTETSPVFTYENLTDQLRTYNVTLTASNSHNCNDSFSFPIEVAPKPIARASADPLNGCAPLNVQFTNTSAGATVYEWDFGDGSEVTSETAPQHLFENNNAFVVAYEATLLAENAFGCSDEATVPITVYPAFQTTLTALPQEGCSPLEVKLTATQGAANYQWDFGDGTIAAGEREMIHTFINAGSFDRTFNISVTGTNAFNCQASATTSVTVYPSPQTVFEVAPTEMTMPQRDITLTNLTQGEGWEYMWDMGDGSNYTQRHPGTHSYSLSGSYTITLTAFNELCSDVATNQILIHPMPPQIDYGHPASGCPPLEVQFYNSTLDATTYLWDFGDGRQSHETSPAHIYQTPGTYKVQLTATGPGGTTVADDLVVTVYQNPTALFEVIPKVIYLPGERPVFINRSENAVSYLWNFGDGNSSTDFAPSHQYSEPGLYSIALTTTSDMGCEDTYTLNEVLKVEAGGEVVFPNAFTPNPEGPSGGRYEYGSPRNTVFYPSTQKGVIEYQLQIFSRWGEIIFESNDVEIGWDGYHKNTLAPQGVYIWRARYKTADGQVKIIAGDVTLIR